MATTALSMGYDKPDLGFVVHYQAPGWIVAYYSRWARGSGDQYAAGILLAGAEDEEILEYFRSSAFPAEEFVEEILDVWGKSDGMTVNQLEQAVNLRSRQIEHALKFLSGRESGARHQRWPTLAADAGRLRHGPRTHQSSHTTTRGGMARCSTLFGRAGLSDAVPSPGPGR